jgi:hypothetical protein
LHPPFSFQSFRQNFSSSSGVSLSM